MGAQDHPFPYFLKILVFCIHLEKFNVIRIIVNAYCYLKVTPIRAGLVYIVLGLVIMILTVLNLVFGFKPFLLISLIVVVFLLLVLLTD